MKNDKKENYYLIGIKGVGLTMLAQFLASSGHRVSGSDIKDVFLTDQVLKKAGIKVRSPFNYKNIPLGADKIIYSSAYSPENNPELAYIKKNKRFKNIPLLSYAQALGEVFNAHHGIAVCGSHGKTTVSAWLGYVLWQTHKNPNVLVGSRVPQFKGSSLKGKSKYFVAEVDEYQNKLQYFRPQGVVLNNIEFDHPDYFKDAAAYRQVFADFIKKIPAKGFLIISAGDKETKKIRNKTKGKVISCGLEKKEKPYYLATAIKQQGSGQVFRVEKSQKDLGEFKIRLVGEHNVLNALLVIASAERLGVKMTAIKKALGSFTGTARRMETLGQYHGALIIDDYAHHPTEVKATLKGVRNHYPDKNIITVFHPHTFTRTKALFKDFVTSFPDTDELIILDIYGSAREKQGGVSSAQLVRAIKGYNKRSGKKQDVRNIKTLGEASLYLRKRLKSQDLLLLMGAGDVFRVGESLLKKRA